MTLPGAGAGELSLMWLMWLMVLMLLPCAMRQHILLIRSIAL